MIFDLELYNIKTKMELHEYLLQQLQLPEYYGNNLDALHDCLSERTDIQGVTLYHFTELQQKLNMYADLLLRVFQDAGIDVIIDS